MVFQRSFRVCVCRLQQLPLHKTNIRTFARFGNNNLGNGSLNLSRWQIYTLLLHKFGFFKLLKWSAIGYFVYRFREYTFPAIKYGFLFVAGCYLSLYWIRFAFYRTFGASMYEKYTFSRVCRTRFESIYKDPIYEQYSTSKLAFLICKTYVKWLFLRPHRQWLHSIQGYLSNYKPITEYLGTGYTHGLAVRPLFVEDSQNGTFRGYFHWFVERKVDFGNDYGIIEIKCDGNINSRVVTINEMSLHQMPAFGGQKIEFKPIKLTIDQSWNAAQMNDSYYHSNESGNKRDNATRKGPKLYQRQTTFLRKRRPSNTIEDADFTIKNPK